MSPGAGPTPQPPILAYKRYAAPSLFTPDGLLRESRRQKGVSTSPVPRICVLDPDGDVVRHLVAEGRAARLPSWACYHTDLTSNGHGRPLPIISARAWHFARATP